MPLVDYVNEVEAPRLVRTIFDALRRSGRRLANSRRVIAHNPDALRALGPFSESVSREAALSNRTKELAILRVSLINGCRY